MKRFFEHFSQVWTGRGETQKRTEEPELSLDQMVVTIDGPLDPKREAELRRNTEARDAYYHYLDLKLDDKVKLTKKDGTSFIGTVKKIYALPPYNPTEDFFAEIINERREGEEINIFAVKTKAVVITKID